MQKEPESKPPIQGSCLCRGVRFSIPHAALRLDHAAHCHCDDCRKFHGSAFSTFAEATAWTWLRGEELLRSFTTPNGSVRQFCSVCGSSLTFRSAGADTLEFALAAFDEPVSELTPDAHVFFDRRVPWVPPSEDGLPRYPGARAGGIRQRC